MSENVKKAIALEELKKLAQRSQAAAAAAQGAADNAFKSAKVENNTVKLYTSADMTGTPAATLDLPVEYLLDQAKTQFVGKFTWSAEDYPGSTNPNLNNKPVMVLAVKGSDASVTYSFLNMATLVDTYSAKDEGKDASTTITISGYEVEVVVNIDTAAGNLLTKTANGLFVGHDTTKADKDTDATEDNLAAFDANGNPVDSGKTAGGATLAETPSEDVLATEAAVKAGLDTKAGTATATPSTEGVGGTNGLMSATDKEKLDGVAAGATKVEASTTPGAVKINGTDTAVVTFATSAEVDAMLDEVFGAAED